MCVHGYYTTRFLTNQEPLLSLEMYRDLSAMRYFWYLNVSEEEIAKQLPMESREVIILRILFKFLHW
jgi:hypothetical protein